MSDEYRSGYDAGQAMTKNVDYRGDQTASLDEKSDWKSFVDRAPLALNRAAANEAKRHWPEGDDFTARKSSSENDAKEAVGATWSPDVPYYSDGGREKYVDIDGQIFTKPALGCTCPRCKERERAIGQAYLRQAAKSAVDESSHAAILGATRAVTFSEALTRLINYHSMETGSGTPDFILADFLADSLTAFDRAVRRTKDRM